MKFYWCKIFGHWPVDVNTRNRTAKCKWCGKRLRVTYDGCYGDTIVEGVIDENEIMGAE